MNTNTSTPIKPEALIERGYTEYPPSGYDTYDRLFQRAIRDNLGRRYFISIREWSHNGEASYDAQLHTDTDTGGYLWATVREDSIEGVEYRIHVLWQAMGSVRYD